MNIMNKQAQEKMNQILAVVKDEYKAEVEEKVKDATERFIALSDEEQEEYFMDCGTIAYFFDDNQLKLDTDYCNVLIDPDDADLSSEFIDLVCDYLDIFLD
jgi:hypothetical protein